MPDNVGDSYCRPCTGPSEKTPVNIAAFSEMTFSSLLPHPCNKIIRAIIKIMYASDFLFISFLLSCKIIDSYRIFYFSKGF
jgi:hypothetical protein